jgi:hypothetical protein
MRRTIPTLVVGSLVFGLVAAVAVDTGFTLSSVGGLSNPGTAQAQGTVAVTEELCDGDYEITWRGTGEDVTGFTFVRTPPEGDADPGLAYCAEQTYAILVGEDGGGQFHTGTTDAEGGATVTFNDGMTRSFANGDSIALKIGPEAAGA